MSWLANPEVEKHLPELHAARSFAEIENWVRVHSNLLFPIRDLGHLYRRAASRGKMVALPQWTVEFERMRHSDCVSNSHHCPYDGVINWGGQVEGAPRGYPGWEGRLNCKLEPSHLGIYPSLEGTGVCTGTGGSHYGFDVRIFDADFPGMEFVHNYMKLTGCSYDEATKEVCVGVE